MTQDEIVKMAREAGLVRAGDKWVEPARWGVTELVHFAGLVFAAERGRARELLERCETEMRYAGWTKYESDNFARHEVYEEVKEFLARGNP